MKSLLLQIAKLESNYKLQLLESEYQKQSPGSALWKRCSKHFGKFTEKHQCQSLFLNKVEGCKLATLLKKRLWHMCFPMDFAKHLVILFL